MNAHVYDESFYFHDEDSLMLSWYGNILIQSLRRFSAKSLISMGIGRKIVSSKIFDEYITDLNRYLIIEGSEAVISNFMSGEKIPSNTELIHSKFEAYTGNEKFDAIEMGFVLEHVEDPLLLLHHYSQFLSRNGTFFIAVPNARSLHRLIGHNAGLLDDVYKLSEYDIQYGHKRYFDLESLTRVILNAGLTIRKTEGIMLKPFSTAQLRSLALPSAVINSLFKVGIDYPEICNGIYIEATL